SSPEFPPCSSNPYMELLLKTFAVRPRSRLSIRVQPTEEAASGNIKSAQRFLLSKLQ
ncbi:hypothetical protein HAX54_049771, partial [Datura stramonium]|nr:hypothetical protein [Datura stramonium]